MQEMADGKLESKVTLRQTYRQYLAALAANLGTLSLGLTLAWTSPTLPKLRDDPSALNLTASQESWVGSLAQYSSVAGPIPTAVLVHLVGCRRTFQFAASLFALGWVLTGAARAVAVLLVARSISGVGLGCMLILVPMYCGEIAQDQIRGRLGSYFRMQVSLGYLIAYSVGPYVSYLALVLVSASFPVMLFFSMLFVPESPYKLVIWGQNEKALEALMWLRCCSSFEAQQELQLIQSYVAKANEQEGTFYDLFHQRASLKALLLIMAIFAFQQFSGIAAITVYNESIFQESGGDLDSSVSAIIVGIVMFLASGSCSLLVDHVGRKPLLIASSVGMAVPMALLGTFFYWKSIGSDTSTVGWLPVTSLVVHIIAFNIGFGTVPYALMGEVFSPGAKNKAAPICSVWLSLVSATIARFFSDLAGALGMYGVFWLFGITTLVGGVFIYFALPETKEKPLHVIHEMLSR